jgi:lipoprotein-releasing system permease protein
VAGVARVVPRIWGAFFSSALQGNITIVGISAENTTLLADGRVLTAGRTLRTGHHEMVLGKTLADALGIQIGDALALPAALRATPSLTVVGIFKSSLDLHTADVVLMDEADARQQLNMPAAEATDFALLLANAAESHVAATYIVEQLPEHRVIERTQLRRTYTLVYGRRAGLVSLMLLPAILVMLLLVVDRLSGVSDRERREVAVLKAIGWSTEEVVTVKLFEALLVGAAAVALGLCTAYAWVFWANGVGLRQALMGYSVLYPTAALTPVVDAAQLLGIGLLVLGPFVGLSALPAWRTAQADPHDVMRGS